MLSARIVAAIVNAALVLMAGAGETRPNVILVHASNEAVKEVGGAFFPQAIAGPYHAASQAELLSGRHEFACGVSHEREGRNLIRADVPLLPERFKQAGYRTALAGDWWLGSALPCRPQDRGFEDIFAAEPEGALEGRWGVAKGTVEETRKTGAMRWLGERATDGKPFLLYLTWPTGESLKPLSGELERLGLSSRTIIVALGERSVGAAFPGNTIAPLRFYYPEKTEAATWVEPVSWMDVAPTVAAWCGVEMEGEGINLGPRATAEADLSRGRKFFLHAGRWPGDDSPERHRLQDFAVRDERWLLSGLEWFDLTKPAAERTNEFDANAGLATAWLNEYGGWWQRASAGLRKPVRIIAGDERQPVVRLNASGWWPSREALKAEGVERCRDQASLHELLEKLADPPQTAALPSVAGHWKLNIAREGHYRVTLWKLPPEAVAEDRKRLGKLHAGTVHLRAGKFELRSGVMENATAVTVGMDFSQGPVDFEAWFDGQLAGERILGAFFVSLERVGDRKLPDPDWEVRPGAKKP